jgi:hypothetical protein
MFQSIEVETSPGHMPSAIIKSGNGETQDAVSTVCSGPDSRVINIWRSRVRNGEGPVCKVTLGGAGGLGTRLAPGARFRCGVTYRNPSRQRGAFFSKSPVAASPSQLWLIMETFTYQVPAIFT